MPPHVPSTKWTVPAFNSTDFTRLGKNEQADAFADMQKELARLIEQVNADWLVRLETERDLASELASRMSGVKPPAAAKACQDWMSRRLEMMSKDNQRFFADRQKFVSSMTRFLSGGRATGT